MRDVQNGGQATSQNRAIFYANLFEPPSDQEKLNKMWTLILAWMKNKGLTYYGAFNALDRNWRLKQNQYIRDEIKLFMARYGSPEGRPIHIWDVCYSQGSSALPPVSM